MKKKEKRPATFGTRKPVEELRVRGSNFAICRFDEVEIKNGVVYFKVKPADAGEIGRKLFGIYRIDEIGVLEGMHVGANEIHADSLVDAMAYQFRKKRRTIRLVELKVVRVIRTLEEGGQVL